MSDGDAKPVPPADMAEQGRLQRWASAIAWPLMSFAVLLAAWEWLVPLARIPEYILPVPSAFFERLWTDRGEIFRHTLVTANEIVLGFLMAAVISIPLGYVIVSIRFLQKAIYPIIVFFQLVPKIAIAPLFVVWFGFRSLPESAADLPALLLPDAGGEHDRVPRAGRACALSHPLHGSLALADLSQGQGPRCADLYLLRPEGVGRFRGDRRDRRRVRRRQCRPGLSAAARLSFLDMPLIFACLVALSVVGILFNYIVDGLEVLLMPWQRKS